MKQIIPFKKDLLLKTKASEITSVSLEHEFKIVDDLVSGEFHITGDYKMTEGSINRENFDFVLPFDIALDSRYKKDSLVVDIDNFYYKLVNDDTLEVNIDLFVDGEKEEVTLENIEEVDREDNKQDIALDNIENNTPNFTFEDLVQTIEDEKEDNLPRDEEEEPVISIENINTNINDNSNVEQNFNVFDNVSDSDTYKTYYVYIVKEDDNVDKIMEKYSISKDDFSLYNDIENIKPGDKVIIPSKNE